MGYIVAGFHPMILNGIVTATNFLAIFIALVVVFFLLGLVFGLSINTKRHVTKETKTLTSDNNTGNPSNPNHLNNNNNAVNNSNNAVNNNLYDNKNVAKNINNNSTYNNRNLKNNNSNLQRQMDILRPDEREQYNNQTTKNLQIPYTKNRNKNYW